MGVKKAIDANDSDKLGQLLWPLPEGGWRPVDDMEKQPYILLSKAVALLSWDQALPNPDGLVKIVDQLIEAGCSPLGGSEAHRTFFLTSFTGAHLKPQAQARLVQVVSRLIGHGIPVDGLSDDGETALWHAVRYGMGQWGNILLAAGTDPRLGTTPTWEAYNPTGKFTLVPSAIEQAIRLAAQCKQRGLALDRAEALSQAPASRSSSARARPRA